MLTRAPSPVRFVDVCGKLPLLSILEKLPTAETKFPAAACAFWFTNFCTSSIDVGQGRFWEHANNLVEQHLNKPCRPLFGHEQIPLGFSHMPFHLPSPDVHDWCKWAV